MAAIAAIARVSAKRFIARASSARFVATIKFTPSHEYIKVKVHQPISLIYN